MKKKPISEHTERELLEKSVLFQKETAENTTFLKKAVIIYAILTVIGALVVAAQFG